MPSFEVFRAIRRVFYVFYAFQLNSVILPDIYDMVEVSFHLMRHLAGMRQEDGQRKTQKVKSLEKGETLQVNIGSCCTTATVKNVNKDQCRLELASPIAAEKNEKVAISRRIERHWRLIGWGEIVQKVEFNERLKKV